MTSGWVPATEMRVLLPKSLLFSELPHSKLEIRRRGTCH